LLSEHNKQGVGYEKDHRRQFDLDVESESHKYPNRYDRRPKMSNVVQELRTGRVLKVDGITGSGRLRCREVEFSRTGRLMRKGKRFLHQADVRPLYRPDINKIVDNLKDNGSIE
jgi:hypothetical protein